MSRWTRRTVLKASVTALGAGTAMDLGFLAPLSFAAAADTKLDPQGVRSTPELSELVRLIRTTPRDQCVPVFVEQIQAGLSYQDFLSALFLATFAIGDPHQIAQVHSAHRLSREARTEERLLPLFWVLDRVNHGLQQQRESRWLAPLPGSLPGADAAEPEFHDAMVKLDPDRAERAIVALARGQGIRRAMASYWEYSARRVWGTFGHHPIIMANTWRTLEAVGWQHAEPVLRYMALVFPWDEADRTYEPNRERAQKALPLLPKDWGADEADRGATLEIYALLRDAKVDAACDLVADQLAAGKIHAATAWDAVHLAAADLLVRYKTGGSNIGSSMIHAVTSTNALRFGFDTCDDDRVRLLLLLQGISALGDTFIGPAATQGQLRTMNLVDLPTPENVPATTLDEVFALLPSKTSEDHTEAERASSDQACQLTLAALRDPAKHRLFMRSARSLLCRKASFDAHDVKYPVAQFEDAERASPEWRPYLLAASVHALHGAKSDDAEVLVQARAALS